MQSELSQEVELRTELQTQVSDRKRVRHSCKDNTDITTIDYIETHFVTNMTYMFNGCKALTSIPKLDTSNVTAMGGMFTDCEALMNIPELDTSNVTVIADAFNGCKALTSIPDLDVSNARYISRMFSGCEKLTTLRDNPYSPESKRWRFKIDVEFSSCPLDRTSILKVFKGLQTVEGKRITISSTTNSYLTDEDKAIATNKGWTISVV